MPDPSIYPTYASQRVNSNFKRQLAGTRSADVDTAMGRQRV
jgi:hypothetical protein